MRKISNIGRVCLFITLVLILSVSTLLPVGISSPPKASAQSLPAYRYTKTFDNANGQADANAVATDSSGDVYVAGYFYGTVIFDGTGGTDSYSTGGDGSGFLTKYNADGSYAWTRTYDSSNGYANNQALAVDSNGNVYVTGQFSGTIVFDGVGGSNTVSTPATTAFITKYSSSGSYLFTKYDVTTSGTSTSNSIAIDHNNNVYITGYYSGTVVFDGVGGSDSLSDSNQTEFMTKYSDNGSYQYTKQFDSSAGGSNSLGSGIAIDSHNNVYVTGTFYGTVVFDGVGGTDSRNQANESGYLTKYSSTGVYQSTKIFDTSASSSGANATAIAIDKNDNVYITGTAWGTVVFDGVGGSDSITFGYTSAFLTKYNSDGSYASTKYLFDDPSSGFAVGQSIAFDSLGDLYLLSGVYGTITFDGPGGTDTQSVGSSFTGAITKFNTNGSYAYTKTIDATSGEDVLAMGAVGGIATDNKGNVYIASFFQGTITFDGPGGTDTRVDQSGSWDSFLLSYAMFIPTATGNQTINTTTLTPAAPNTGFGSAQSENISLLLVIMSVPLAISALVYSRKKYKLS